MLPGAGAGGAGKLFPNWNGPPGAALRAGALEAELPNWKTPEPPVDPVELDAPKLKPLLLVEPPNGLEESAGFWPKREFVDELVDIPGCAGLLPKAPNAVIDVELPNGATEPLPNAGAVVELDDAKTGMLLDVVPNSGAAVEPPNKPPEVVEVEDVAPPKFPNFGGSVFWSPPNDNFVASDENKPRLAGTPPSVVVVPTSPGNWIGFPKNDDEVESGAFAENKFVAGGWVVPKRPVAGIGADCAGAGAEDAPMFPKILPFGASPCAVDDAAPKGNA